MNYNVLATTFSKNNAEIGGYLATNPTQMHFKVYEVPEFYLFIDDVSVHYILSHPDTVREFFEKCLILNVNIEGGI